MAVMIGEQPPSERERPQPYPEPYRVSVEQCIAYRKAGFLAVPNLVSPEEIAELRQHTEDLMQGHLPEQSAG